MQVGNKKVYLCPLTAESKPVFIVPVLPVRGKKNVGTVLVNVDTMDILSVDVAGNVIPAVDNLFG